MSIATRLMRAIALAAAIAGCTPAPLRDCDKPYASTLPQCAAPKRGPRRDLVEVCEYKGLEVECYLVERDEVARILRQTQPPFQWPRTK